MIWQPAVLALLFLAGVTMTCKCQRHMNRSKLYNFTVNGCNPATENCSVSFANPVAVVIDFEPEVSSNTLDDFAMGCKDSESFQIYLNITNKCEEIPCPIRKGVRYYLQDTVPAYPNYPTGPVEVLYRFIGDHNMGVLCSTANIIFEK